MEPLNAQQQPVTPKDGSLAWSLFTCALLAFLLAVGAMLTQSGVLTNSATKYPPSVMAAGIMLIYITIAHSALSLLLTFALLVMRRWRFAAGVFGLGLVAAAPLLFLFFLG